MKWYAGRLTKMAAGPPAYLIERISDLRNASDVSKTAPGVARSLLREIIAQLESHNDKEFAAKLAQAERKMLDSPKMAREIIIQVVSAMLEARDVFQEEAKRPQWRKRK